MITPETLTDEVIRRSIDAFALAGQPWIVTACFEALGPSDMFWDHQQPTPESMLVARQRICDAINARTGAKP